MKYTFLLPANKAWDKFADLRVKCRRNVTAKI